MQKTEGKDKGCCKDKQQFVKNTADQKTAESSIQFIYSFVANVPVSFLELSVINFPFFTEENLYSNSPPRSHHIALYLFKRAFLI